MTLLDDIPSFLYLLAAALYCPFIVYCFRALSKFLLIIFNYFELQFKIFSNSNSTIESEMDATSEFKKSLPVLTYSVQQFFDQFKQQVRLKELFLS